MEEAYSKILAEFSTLCLRHMDERKHFTDKDLFNVTLIFQDVFMGKMFDYMQKNKMPQEDAEVQAEQAGKQLRQLLLIYTGIDMHKVAKQ